MTAPVRPTATEATAATVPIPRGTRSRSELLQGAVLVLTSALIFYVTSLRADPRTPVLALAAAVPAGHVLTDADLIVTQVSADDSVAVVPASQRAGILGQSAALPLTAHQLLTRQDLGPSAWPPAGQAEVAEPVAAGHLPDGVANGSRVLVMVLPAAAGTVSGSASLTQVHAIVTAVGEQDSSGNTQVSLLMSAADATTIAAANQPVGLVLLGTTG